MPTGPAPPATRTTTPGTTTAVMMAATARKTSTVTPSSAQIRPRARCHTSPIPGRRPSTASLTAITSRPVSTVVPTACSSAATRDDTTWAAPAVALSELGPPSSWPRSARSVPTWSADDDHAQDQVHDGRQAEHDLRVLPDGLHRAVQDLPEGQRAQRHDAGLGRGRRTVPRQLPVPVLRRRRAPGLRRGAVRRGRRPVRGREAVAGRAATAAPTQAGPGSSQTPKQRCRVPHRARARALCRRGAFPCHDGPDIPRIPGEHRGVLDV